MIFYVKFPDNTTSFISATNKKEALDILDEIASVELKEIKKFKGRFLITIDNMSGSVTSETSEELFEFLEELWNT